MPETAQPRNRAERRHPNPEMTIDLGNRLMAVNEVADFLATHRAMVYRLMARGELPYVTVGTRRRVRMSDVQAYLDRVA